MAQRTPPSRPGSSSRPAAGSGRGGSGRGGQAPRGGSSGRAGSRRAAPVKKPFPVGFAVGCTVLAIALVGIIVFAVQNQGVGAKGTLKQADQISGLHVTSKLSRNHVAGVLSYPKQATQPPVGGNHNPVPQTCQVYTKQIPNEDAVHSLEHGAVWITYNPSLSAADVKVLAGKVAGNPYRMLSPYPGQAAKISLQAWGRQLAVSAVTDKRIDTFLKNFTGGPQAPEPGSACSGNTSTGTTPAGAGAAGAMKRTPAPSPAK